VTDLQFGGSPLRQPQRYARMAPDDPCVSEAASHRAEVTRGSRYQALSHPRGQLDKLLATLSAFSFRQRRPNRPTHPILRRFAKRPVQTHRDEALNMARKGKSMAAYNKTAASPCTKIVDLSQ
jgi:hypothetical protein